MTKRKDLEAEIEKIVERAVSKGNHWERCSECNKGVAQALAKWVRGREKEYCNCKEPDLVELMDGYLIACKGCHKEYMPPQKEIEELKRRER